MYMCACREDFVCILPFPRNLLIVDLQTSASFRCFFCCLHLWSLKIVGLVMSTLCCRILTSCSSIMASWKTRIPFLVACRKSRYFADLDECLRNLQLVKSFEVMLLFWVLQYFWWRQVEVCCQETLTFLLHSGSFYKFATFLELGRRIVWTLI